MPLSDADIVSAFEWILGREPEAEAIAWHRKNFSTRDELRRHLFNSAEFMNFLPFSMDAGRDQALDFLRPRVVFLHLPKTGGTSLANLLESAFKEDEIFPDRYMIARHPATVIARHHLFHGHYTRQEILVIPGQVHVVTMLREPRSRLISQYRFHRALIRDRATTGKDILVAKSALAFKDYLADPEVRAHTGVNNSATRNLFSLDSTIPESLRLAAAAQYQQGQLRPAIAVAVACAAIDSMSWVTTTEQLNATASSLGPRLGLDLDLSRLKTPLMVTDNMSREAPERFAQTERIDLDDETEDLMEELIAMDRIVYRHVQLKVPLRC